MFTNLIEVKNHGLAFAATVLKFRTPVENPTVRIPKPINARDGDTFGVFTVDGDSLSSDGIRHMDVLICRFNFEWSDMRANKYVVAHHYNYGNLVKKIVFEADGSIRLTGADVFNMSESFALEQLEILALVVTLMRHL